LLRACAKRPRRRRGAKQEREIAPPHSIASSAVTRGRIWSETPMYGMIPVADAA